MGAHGGIWRFGHEASSANDRGWLDWGLAGRASGGATEICDGPVAVVVNRCDPHLVDEQVPLSAVGEHLVLWDGRLDNRSTLVAHLGYDHLRTASDAVIVQAAYGRWGRDALRRLIGDWALVIWDKKDQTLLLARDFFGNKALYYQLRNESLMWSCDLNFFLEASPEKLQLERHFLTRFLVSAPTLDQTPYVGVCAVRPGTVLVFRPSGYSKHNCWSPDLWAEIRYKSDEDYAEHFLELFQKSVRNRIQVKGPVWAELSGGLDSSSIVCLASEIIKNGDAPSQLHTVSYVFDSTMPEDEREFIGMVEDQCRTPSLHVGEADFSAFMFDEPNYALSRPVGFAGRPRYVAKRMREAGAQVLLRGHGGDALMFSTKRYSPDVADHLAAGKLMRAHQAARNYSLHSMRPYWDILWHDGLKPLLPNTIVSRCPTVRPAWLAGALATEEDCPAPASGLTDLRRLPISRRLAWRFLQDAIEVTTAQGYQCCGVGVSADPFMDRMLVQFMLSVPFEQKARPGCSRWLHRNALQGVLPRAIQTRTSKASGDGVISRAIRRDWHRLIELFSNGNSRLQQIELINTTEFLDELNRARHGLQHDSISVLRAIAMEHWLRCLESRAT